MLVSRLLRFCAVVLALVLQPHIAGAQNAVSSSIKGTATGSTGGRLSSGAIVRQGEVVTTSASSTVNLVTRDRANVTLGANTTTTVTNTSPGNVALNVSQGAFRFISGSAADRSTIRTPLATVGVRGTIIEGYVSRSPPREVFALVEGAMEVCVNSTGQCALVTQPGTFVAVTPGTLIGPLAWNGPTLDLDAGVNFVQIHVDEVLSSGRDVQPRWQEGNEALESRNLGGRVRQPPVTPSGGGGCSGCRG